MFWLILFFTLVGSVLSLFGGALLLWRKKPFTHQQSLWLISFASGVLLGTAFLDLLPEAAELMEELNLMWVLAGVVGLFVLEKLVIWYHHHEHEYHTQKISSYSPEMIMIGDTVHNFIDGVVIAGAFLVSVPVGIVTSLAVAAHEIPHEMADFGVLLSKGWARKKTIMINLMSSLAAVLGAMVLYFGRGFVEVNLGNLLAFSGGMFIYLACSDLIPELHHDHDHGVDKSGQNLFQVVMMGAGILVVYVLRLWLEH